MAMTGEERGLHDALADLVAAQPPMPDDRVDAVRRRHRRRRVTQSLVAAGAAAVTVVAVLLGTVVLPGGSHAIGPAHRDVPSWALPWPDHRDGSVPQRVLDAAVADWERAAHPDLLPPAHTEVVWYAGGLVPGTDKVIAVFEVDGARRLVAASAARSEVSHGSSPYGDAATPWVFYDVAAPAPATADRLIVGTYVTAEAQGGSPGMSRPDNVAVLLTSPSVPSVQLRIPGSDGVQNEGWPIRNGFAVVDVGALVGPVTVTARGPQGVLAGPARVGLPGSPDSQVPQLLDVRDPVAAAGPHTLGPVGGQGTMTIADSSVTATRSGDATAYLRCRGPGRLRLVVGSRAFGSVPCDDKVHTLTAGHIRPEPLSGQGPSYLVQVTASRFARWKLAIVLR